MRASADLIERIAAHARAVWPHECCGLLLGAGDRLESSWPARNLRASPTRFLVDPRDHLAAVRHARAAGTTVAGVYHSHPHSPAVPSARDAREASYTEFVYLICGPVSRDGVLLERPPVRAWRLDAGHFVEVPLIIGRQR